MLDKLLGSKTREIILHLYLSKPDGLYYARDIEHKLGLPVSAVRRELVNLAQLGFLREVPESELGELGRDERENQEIRAQKRKYYAANSDFIFYPELKALFAKNKFLSRDNLVKKIKHLGPIELLVLSGIFVEGSDSQVDILIVGDIEHDALASLIASFEKELNNPIYYTVFTREEYDNRKAVTDRFLFEILQGRKIELVNTIDYPGASCTTDSATPFTEGLSPAQNSSAKTPSETDNFSIPSNPSSQISSQNSSVPKPLKKTRKVKVNMIDLADPNSSAPNNSEDSDISISDFTIRVIEDETSSEISGEENLINDFDESN